MLEKYYRCRRTIEYLRMGPLRDHVDPFIKHLQERGYPEEGLQKRLTVVNTLSHWLGLKQIPLSGLSQERIEEFITFHKYCRRYQTLRDARELIGFLRTARAIPKPKLAAIQCPIERILKAYSDYLSGERGLQGTSVRRQVYYGRRFMSEAFKSGIPRFSKLNAREVSQFVTRHSGDNGPAETAHMVQAVRSFLKFLQMKGKIHGDLAAVVPKPACWRETTLPLSIRPEEVQALLRSCDRKTKIGKRDFAILTLLSRMGIRGIEALNLLLNDIHWNEGEITIRGKGKESRLPLPKDVGSALADYLKNGRPQSPHRAVFLSVLAPYEPIKRTSSIGGVVRFAMKRAGVEAARKGSHLLRHTVANECLRRGATLSEIGDLLRHQHLGTTVLYAKVDFERLRELAMPWPTNTLERHERAPIQGGV
jgi:integrase/recombinase XerD